MAIAEQGKYTDPNLQINWFALLSEEEDFDEALRIIRVLMEKNKRKRGRFLLKFSIEKQ
jgi:hypothetical protein